MVYLTKEQRKAVYRLFLRTQTADVQAEQEPAPDSYRAFRATVQPYIGGECVLVPALGMWFGIEKDGYTHT